MPFETTCVDTSMLASCWATPQGSNVLEVGCQDESAEFARYLQEHGYHVTAVDLRPPTETHSVLEKFYQADFLSIYAHHEQFDAAVSISALEHFGLNTYGENHYRPYADLLALHKMWQALKTGGLCYLTVPYGNRYHECYPHWRVYDEKSLQERLVQDFVVEEQRYFCSADAPCLAGTLSTGTEVKKWQADTYPTGDNYLPHVTVFLRMKKV